MKKLYLTTLAIVIATLSTGIIHAKSKSVQLVNNTLDTIYVQFNYRKNGHKSDQGSQVTVQAGKTGTGSWVDNLKNVYAANSSMSTNSDGKFFAGGQNRPTGLISIADHSVSSNSSNPLTFTKDAQGNLSATIVVSSLYQL
ncbi:MAG: hypothetical protein Q8Q60_04710 [Candidatus Chromulinivorax sp.]|nr:hypothetical protein [Candidatus Chromulinivorax sp.]